MRWTPNLLTRLLAPYLLALVAVAASLYLYGDRVFEHLYFETLAEKVLQQAHLAGDLLPWNERADVMDQRCAALAGRVGARVTVIAADGSVIGDSEAASATLENHRDRPEVRTALRDGDGQAVRLSTTVNRLLFYRAWRQLPAPGGATEPRVIRLAVSMATIDDARHRIRVSIFGGVGIAALAALLPALVLARRLSRRVTRLAAFSDAVARGTPAPALLPDARDLVGQLETNLLAMADSLSARLQAVRDEKSMLEAVLSGMVEGVLVIDRNGVIQLANQRAEQLLGLTAMTRAAGQPLINVSRDPDLQELVRGVLRDADGGHRATEITLNAEPHDRDVLYVTATPVSNADSTVGLVILVFHDISELRRLETVRRDFVANVSHELRTPLTAIRGYAETLQHGAIDDPAVARKFIAIIERHSERLGRLTDDLLTLSDLELGRTALQRADAALAPIVEGAIDMVRDKAEHGHVTIIHALPADLPRLYADADRIEQVLVNLLDNAVKNTPAGGQVTVSAREVDRPPNGHAETNGRVWVEMRVADTGIGIPSHDLPRLTERFYRVDKARSRELGGTGLGLAIVKHIVHAHGGSLRIESEVGHGTAVSVLLPAADAVQTA